MFRVLQPRPCSANALAMMTGVAASGMAASAGMPPTAEVTAASAKMALLGSLPAATAAPARVPARAICFRRLAAKLVGVVAAEEAEAAGSLRLCHFAAAERVIASAAVAAEAVLRDAVRLRRAGIPHSLTGSVAVP